MRLTKRRCAFFALLAALPFIGSCATALEAYQATQEPPSVEMVIDRVNTAARVLELEDIMLHAMPFSAGSRWPQDCDKTIPAGDMGKLGAIAAQDALFSPGSVFRPSFIRIRTLYLQTILFDSAPSLHYQRKYIDSPPDNDAIRAYGQKTLGGDYNPVFNKSFYRFLRYTPDFVPQRRHFEGKFENAPAEYFANLEDAVISLADNQEQLQKIRGDMLETEDGKKRAVRDMNDAARQIKKLKDEDERKNAAEIADMENEMAVHRKEYNDAAARYEELLGAWKLELAKVKRQTTAFTPEQRELAVNVQAAVGLVKGLHIDASALVFIAMARLPDSLMNLPDELNRLMRAPFAGERVARLLLNVISLKDNVVIIRNELGQHYAEADAMDGLFDSRIKTAAVKRPEQPPSSPEDKI